MRTPLARRLLTAALASALLLSALALASSLSSSSAAAPTSETDPTSTLYLPGVRGAPAAPLGPCAPGQTIADPANDVAAAHIDVTSLTTSLSGETLRATLRLRDIPTTLTFNRNGVCENCGEYEWAVSVDTDNNPGTGSTRSTSKGAEYSLTAFHSVVTPNAPVALPIEDGVKVYLCQWVPAESTLHCVAGGTLSVDAQQETLTLTGDVPGIQADSRLFFYAKDNNPGGPFLEETSACAVTTSAAGR